MNLQWLHSLLDEEVDGGSIHGYITDVINDVQLKNYLHEHLMDGALPIIQKKYKTVALLKSIWVDEEKRGQGIGTHLLTNFIDNAQAKRAEAIILIADTSESNEFNLVEWYESYGFQIFYGIRNVFPLMVKEL
jgi:ribosomal protein S18 acetylase RimI-like enzyme